MSYWACLHEVSAKAGLLKHDILIGFQSLTSLDWQISKKKLLLDQPQIDNSKFFTRISIAVQFSEMKMIKEVAIMTLVIKAK